MDRKEEAADLARGLAEAAERNARWRRSECMNLIPSEQPTSAFVDQLISSEPAARYNEHNRDKSRPPDAPHVRYYQGTDFIMEKEEDLKTALRFFFGCRQVETRVISGQMANEIVFDALKQLKRNQRAADQTGLLRCALIHSLKNGGHLSAQPMGALKNYVAPDTESGAPVIHHFPCKRYNPYMVDVEKTKRLIGETRPDLLIFGRSVILYKEPVREIVQFIHNEFGANNPDRPLVMYDGAHILGLIGPNYQDPLVEGADILTGSTHKTFFGPQRGIVLSNITSDSAFYELWLHIEARTFPGHVSNHHLGTLLGLLGATYEMIRYRDEYPKQVIANAKAFAKALADCGLVVEGDPGCWFTNTHQVVLRADPAKGREKACILEDNNVITNAQALYDDDGFAVASGLRLGTQEMTRYGMKETDFRELAQLIADIVSKGQSSGAWRENVVRMRKRFTRMQYCF